MEATAAVNASSAGPSSEPLSPGGQKASRKERDLLLPADTEGRVIDDMERRVRMKGRRITEIIANANGRPIFSLEFFPAKTQQGLDNLYMRIARMVSDLDPSWIQITWGAGGSTQSTSLELAGRVQNGVLGHGRKGGGEKSIYARNVCLHLTCTNVEKASLDQTLDRALSLGICNILALRGDPPRGQEYWVAADDRFQHATDLVEYIRQRHGDAFCIGVAAYPELHPDAENASPADELTHLMAKERAGADFIVTQLFYDVDTFLRWYAECRAHGITIPIIPGVMPIQNYQTLRRVTSLCKASVPQAVWDAVEPIRSDDAAVRDVGVVLAKQMLQRICEQTDVRAFHVCTLNLEKSVRMVLQGLQWTPSEATSTTNDFPGKDKTHVAGLTALSSSETSNSHVKSDLSRALVEETAATWDEFPNGRYGDARSPAFGQIDGYGVSLKVPPNDALKQWGTPISADDISAIFVRYLQGELDVIPWCDCPILPETHSIRKELIRLNAPSGHAVELKGGGDDDYGISSTTTTSVIGKGWWTVGSQPSADGVDSSDPVFGFGPAHGYIFQKAFVEFFASAGEMLELEQRIEAYNAEQSGACLSFFAGNRAGELRTNVNASEGESCAVTWGCFAGKEIVQSTIIEAESFKAWCEEAFEIWSEWELLFLPGSKTRKLLHEIGAQRWLVTVIHHDYKNPDALWAFLGVR